MQKKRFSSLQIFVTVVAVMFVSAVFTAYATPPVSRYTPGETLDPTCAPGDVECSVIPINIGDEVGSGNEFSVLFIGADGLLDEDNDNLLYDYTLGVLYADYVTLANNLDLAMTTNSTVGNITLGGERVLHFYSPGATAVANRNFFLGYQSGNYTLTGATGRNIGIGSNTLDSLTTGVTNNAVGFNAGTNITIGQSNNLFGGSAGQNLTTGTNNTGVGQAVLYGGGGIGTNTGSYNVGVGDIAMYQITEGLRNAGLGYAALENVTSGDDNVGIGYAAGNDVGTGSRGTYLGAWSDNDTGVADVSDVIAIGYGAIARADHQMVVGSDTSYIDDIYFGRGVKSATPNDVTINPTGGFGTDIAGADLLIAGGKGTGSAVGGDVIFTTANAGLTGTTLQSLTEKMRLTYAGRLGLGTTTPDSEFEISGETQNIELILSGYNGRKAVFAGRSANGTEASPTPSAANDILAEFAGQGYGTTGFAPSSTAAIRVVAEEAFDDAGYGSQLLFRTTPNNSTTLTSRMVIMADGNVGIGDTTPDDLLNIESNTNTGISISAIGADVDPYVKFELVDGTSSFIMGIDDSDGDSFKISTTALGTSDRFIIDSSGNINVGGDTTPGSLFSVGSTSQFQVGSSGSIDAVTTIMTSGGITIASSGTGALNVGTTAGTYRTTNAGGNVIPQTVFDVDNSNSSAGSQAYLFDTTNGFVFTGANGTRRIARAAIDITNLVNTSGSETADLAFFTKPSGAAITERLRIESTGDVGIGDTTPDYLLDVENTGADTDIFALTDSDGACLHNPEAGSETVTCSSDERLKENIVDAQESLAYLMDFRIREYDVRASGDHMMGVIAQEIMEIHPELVAVGGNGFYTVELPSTWRLVKAIQELNIKVTSIESLDTTEENSLANRLVLWFADAANGIQNIFAKRVTVEELCFDDVCLTKQDVLELLNDTGSNIDEGPDPEPNQDGGDITPPVDEEIVPPVDNDPNEGGNSDSGVNNEDTGGEESAPTEESNTGGETTGETGDSDTGGASETADGAI